MTKGDPSVNIGITDTGATTSSGPKRVLLLGIKTASGAGAVDTPTRIFSDADGTNFAGEGSQLEQMILYARAQFPRVNLTAVAMDAPAGAASVGSVAFGGAATTATPLLLQIEDKTITVPVSIGDVGSDIATSASAELANFPKLHVGGVANLADLDLTAKSFGEHGNLIRIRVKEIPPGVTATATPMASGTGAADVAAALASLGAVRYHLIVLPDTNATNLTAVIAELNDRFTGEEAIDGHAFAGLRDTVGTMATFGLGEDTKQVTVFGDPFVPTNPWAQVAAVAAARAERDNPIFALFDVPLTAITAPDEAEYLPPNDRDTLLLSGVSAFYFVQGVPRVRRMVTLAKTNDDGQTSEALYDAETKLTISEYRALRKLLFDAELGKTLVDDISASEFGIETSRRIIDAETMRGLMIAQFIDVFGPLAWVSDQAGFQDSLVLEKTDANTLTFVEAPKINGIFYFANGLIAFTR